VDYEETEHYKVYEQFFAARRIGTCQLEARGDSSAACALLTEGISPELMTVEE
jgi:hypothetical protein